MTRWGALLSPQPDGNSLGDWSKMPKPCVHLPNQIGQLVPCSVGPRLLMMISRHPFPSLEGESCSHNRDLLKGASPIGHSIPRLHADNLGL